MTKLLTITLILLGFCLFTMMLDGLSHNDPAAIKCVLDNEVC